MNSEFHPSFCKPIPQAPSPIEQSFNLNDEAYIEREMDILDHTLSQKEIDENRTIKSGYVDKKFRTRKQWKKRWLVLRNHILSVYIDEKEYELKNSIDLFRTSVIEEYVKKKRENVICIGTPKKNYYFQCYSAQDCKDWLKALRSARDSIPQGSLTSPQIGLTDSKYNNKATSDSEGSWGSGHHSVGSISSHPSNSPPYPSEGLELISDYSDAENEQQKVDFGPNTPPLSSSPNNMNLSKAVPDLENLVYMQGTLYKHCEGFRAWRKRWFVLRDDKLCYYKSDKEYELLAMIPLNSISDVSLATTTSKSKVHCFKIKSTKRTYKLATLDENERDKWVSILQEKIQHNSSL